MCITKISFGIILFVLWNFLAIIISHQFANDINVSLNWCIFTPTPILLHQHQDRKNAARYFIHAPSNMEFRNELISWTSISNQVQPRLKVVVGTVGETTGKREKGWRVTLTLNELRNYLLSHLRQSMSNVRAFKSRGDSKMKIWTTTNFILFLTKLYLLH